MRCFKVNAILLPKCGEEILPVLVVIVVVFAAFTGFAVLCLLTAKIKPDNCIDRRIDILGDITYKKIRYRRRYLRSIGFMYSNFEAAHYPKIGIDGKIHTAYRDGIGIAVKHA